MLADECLKARAIDVFLPILHTIYDYLLVFTGSFKIFKVVSG